MHRDRPAPDRQRGDRPHRGHDRRSRGLRRGRIHRPLHRLSTMGHPAQGTSTAAGGHTRCTARGGGLRSRCPPVGRTPRRSAHHRCHRGRFRASPHRRLPGRCRSGGGSSAFGRAERRRRLHLPGARLYAGTTYRGRRTRSPGTRCSRQKPTRTGNQPTGTQRWLHPHRRLCRQHRAHRSAARRVPFNDAQQFELDVCTLDDIALSAVTTVVHTRGRTAVVDAGSKVLGADRPGWATGFGRVIEEPDARIVALSEHHATVEFPNAAPTPGTRLRIAPNHLCNAVNLVDALVIDAADGVQHWAVAARGANT